MPNKYIILITIPILLGGAYLLNKYQRKKSYSTVIILNGPSAAGKSSIQKEFQTLMMPSLWIKLGIDNLFDNPMPEITSQNLSYWQSANPIRWIETTKDNDNNPVITLFVGDHGEKVAYGMNSAIAAYAQNGCNCIVDYIAYKKEWLADLQNKLQHYNTIWVKVQAPITTLEERETARRTSPQGHARSHYETVFWDISYDLIANTDNESAAEIAHRIKQFMLL